MDDDALISERSMDPDGPSVVYTLSVVAAPSQMPRSPEIVCTVRDDNTLKLQIKNHYGVPVAAVIIELDAWTLMVREVERVWK